MTPYMLRNCGDYGEALLRANGMLANRGFDMSTDALETGEIERAAGYVKQSVEYIDSALLPFVRNQLELLADSGSPAERLYREAIDSVDEIHAMLSGGKFRELIEEDPRHLFLLSSSAKYPHLFHGYRGENLYVPRKWKMMGCTILKMCHLIRSIEEDSQDINDYARLGMFLESRGKSSGPRRHGLGEPTDIPEDECARPRFVTIGDSSEAGQSVSRREDGLVSMGDGVKFDNRQIRRGSRARKQSQTRQGREENPSHPRHIAITLIRNSGPTLSRSFTRCRIAAYAAGKHVTTRSRRRSSIARRDDPRYGISPKTSPRGGRRGVHEDKSSQPDNFLARSG
jgi:hypothetical protein